MRHGLATSVQVPNAVVTEQIVREFSDGISRSLETLSCDVATQAFVLYARHGDGVSTIALLEGNVLSLDAWNFELYEANNFILEALLVHIRRWWFERNILRY